MPSRPSTPSITTVSGTTVSGAERTRSGGRYAVESVTTATVAAVWGVPDMPARYPISSSLARRRHQEDRPLHAVAHHAGRDVAGHDHLRPGVDDAVVLGHQLVRLAARLE